MRISYPNPSYITFDDWYKQIIKKYSSERIPAPFVNDPWYISANKLRTVDLFRKIGIPKAKEDNDWNDWAKIVYLKLKKYEE